jgi:hypothetical protein
MNREDTFSLSRSWKPLHHTLKEQKNVFCAKGQDILLDLTILSRGLKKGNFPSSHSLPLL